MSEDYPVDQKTLKLNRTMENRRTSLRFLFVYLFVNNVFIVIQSKERK